MKQETTKEAAERMSIRVMEILFKDEKKWQQSYSEEEVIEILNQFDYSFDSIRDTIPQWFEQFKKK